MDTSIEGEEDGLEGEEVKLFFLMVMGVLIHGVLAFPWVWEGLRFEVVYILCCWFLLVLSLGKVTDGT